MAIFDLKANIDLKQNLNLYTTCKQLDSLNLILSVFDNSVQTNLTNYNVRLKAMKADKVPLVQEHTGISISGNVITIETDEQFTTTSGKTLIELQFIDEVTGKKKATFNLVLIVVSTTLEVERGISKATYTLLEELENKLDQASDFFENIEDAIVANNNLKKTISNSETAESNLETAITNANNKKNEVNAAITNATNKIAEVNTSISNANASKIVLDRSKEVADTTKSNLDSANELAEHNIEELNKLGDATDLAAKVQTNTENISKNTKSIEEVNSHLNDITKYGSHDVIALGLAVIDVPSVRTYSINSTALTDYATNNKGVELYFPSGQYNLNSTINFLYGASLNLHKEAVIIATNNMDIMFSFSNTDLTLGQGLNKTIRHQKITGGTINGNNKAKICIKAQGFQDFIIKDTRIQNFINKGIYSLEPSAELKIDNVYFFNETSTIDGIDNVTDNIAMDIQSTDNYIHNCTIVDCSIGIAIGKGGNYIDKVHYWINSGVRIPYSVAFWTQSTGYARWHHCVSDTAMIGFKCGNTTTWIEQCEIITSSFLTEYFPNATSTAIYIEDNTADYILNINNCSFANWSNGALTVQCLNISTSVDSVKRTNIQGNTYWGDIANKPREDYEYYSQTFTPSITGKTVAGTPTYTTRFGRYHRIGKQVWVTVNIKATMDATIDGDLLITGLPYYSATGNSALNVGFISNFPEQVINPTIIGNSNQITLYEVHEDKTCSTVWSQDIRLTTIEIWITGSYIIQ